MKKRGYGKTILLFIISIIYTVLVTFVDKQTIGPEGTSVGFSAINKVFLDLISYNPMWDKITDLMLMIAILTAVYFAATGFIQLLKEKRPLAEIDKDILIMGFLYVILVIMYVLFDKVPINYRPVILDEGLEPSYPSTHDLMTLAFFVFTIVNLKIMDIKKKSANCGKRCVNGVTRTSLIEL